MIMSKKKKLKSISLVPKLQLGNADGCSSTQKKYKYFLLIPSCYICYYRVKIVAVCIPKLELGNEKNRGSFMDKILFALFLMCIFAPLIR
jgi:hypothetical protein